MTQNIDITLFDDSENVNTGRLTYAKITAAILFARMSSHEKPTKNDFSSVNGSIPSIGLEMYIYRIFKYGLGSRNMCIATIVELDRFIHLSAGTYAITRNNVHRLYAISYLVVTKMYEDEYYDNSHFARIAGMPVAELNVLELKFLKILGFSAALSKNSFYICDKLFREISEKIGTHEDFESYFKLMDV